MTRERKSAVAIAAREKARLKAQEMTARHELLLEKAAAYFELEEQSTHRLAQAQREAQHILEQAAQGAATERSHQAGIVAQMLATGEPKALVAQRLGLSSAALRTLLEAQPQQT